MAMLCDLCKIPGSAKVRKVFIRVSVQEILRERGIINLERDICDKCLSKFNHLLGTELNRLLRPLKEGEAQPVSSIPDIPPLWEREPPPRKHRRANQSVSKKRQGQSERGSDDHSGVSGNPGS